VSGAHLCSPRLHNPQNLAAPACPTRRREERGEGEERRREVEREGGRREGGREGEGKRKKKGKRVKVMTR